ncbi:MAG: hypothetical protein U9Q95_04000, partial [Candidatus Eisenbacteria bacterium]|nr:hypothetical protein [Candidatus Eisenbacteria bacterium]
DALARELPRDAAGSPLIAMVPNVAGSATTIGVPAVTGETATSLGRPNTPPANGVPSEEGASAVSDSGGLELHDLSVWDSPDDRYVYLSFAPISMESFFGDVPLRQVVVEGEEVEVADVAPVLDEAHVGVELDGEPAVVTSLHWYYAGHGDLGGADVKYMPVCLIRIERPELSAGEHGLSLRIEDVGTGAVGMGSATFECGRKSSQL